MTGYLNQINEHGMTGYLNQINEQICSSKYIQKELSSEQFKSSELYPFNAKTSLIDETSYSELLGTRKLRKINLMEKKLFDSSHLETIISIMGLSNNL